MFPLEEEHEYLGNTTQHNLPNSPFFTSSMSIPTQQKALFLRAAKGDFYLGSTNVDKPGPGEVLVRIEATALNPVDWKIQTSGYFITEWPAILGTDSAGVVVALGEGVTKFAVGDKM